MKLVTEEDARHHRARAENWIRGETCQLTELLRTHVQLALDSGTDHQRIRGLLLKVRTAILDTREDRRGPNPDALEAERLRLVAEYQQQLREEPIDSRRLHSIEAQLYAVDHQLDAAQRGKTNV